MWDYAAGALILEESGGEMRSIRHPNFWEGDLWTKGVIAANSPELFEQWESWIRGNVLDFIGR